MASETASETHSVAGTERVAGEIAAALGLTDGRGGVVALDGDLGAGKTQFVRGLVRALGGDPALVHSPTFVLLHDYPLPNGRHLYHLDAYRVGGDDFEAIGFDELLAATDAGDVVAVEWPSRVEELLPAGTICVKIETLSPTVRRITLLGPEVPHEDAKAG